jgi:aminoglycoside phosphotransferase (APT) family kinase protein
VLSAPVELAEDALASALAHRWKVAVTSMVYRPVGFGSHHWEILDVTGTRWFVTVDDLETKRMTEGEPLSQAHDRLRSALAAARALQDHGYAFVVAPVPTIDGEPLARVDEKFGLALYPFVDGQTFDWEDFTEPSQRRAVLDMVVAVHTAPSTARQHARVDDFAIPYRDEVEVALDEGRGNSDLGPYAQPTALLLTENAAPIRRLRDRYDEHARQAQLSRAVLTHGEPHPGNTMLTGDGWRLIDWDTALVAPPERDLWTLDPGDGSHLAAYAEATGVTPLSFTIELYRIRWDLTEIAEYVSRFRRPHPGNHDDDKSWEELHSLIARITA